MSTRLEEMKALERAAEAEHAMGRFEIEDLLIDRRAQKILDAAPELIEAMEICDRLQRCADYRDAVSLIRDACSCVAKFENRPSPPESQSEDSEYRLPIDLSEAFRDISSACGAVVREKSHIRSWGEKNDSEESE